MGRKWPKTFVISTVVAGAGAVLALTGCGSSGDEPSGDGTSRTDAGSSHGAETRTDDRSFTPAAPTGPARRGPAPAAVPSVREWSAVRGPGWEPNKYTRVVVASGDRSLTDEGKLLAAELKVPFHTGRARTGDVRLTLSDGARTGREGYVLTAREGQVRITGSDDAGVFYGTRTLLQAVRDRGRLADGVVKDRPDRAQRGFMLDIARKHFSADWIEKRIKEMGDLKLNQLQLHLSDDQAFRLESDSHPEIVSKDHLTKAQVRRIVKLAASRHITVIPEIDSPGHLGAVIDAHPGLQLRNAGGTPAPGAVDISDPEAAKIVDDLLREYADLFPGRYWHIGGDEYRALTTQDPAASYPELAAAARKKYGDGATVQDLATGWLNDRARTVRKAGKTPQVWNDGMHRGGKVRPHHDREVTYWTGKEIGAREPVEYLKEGWKTLNLNDEYLYYVLGEPNEFTYPTGERIYKEWTPAVLRGTEPVPERLAGPERVPGGRFAVWCDIADAQSTAQIAEGIRLPLAAVSQKLWNPGDTSRSWASFRALAERVG